MSQCTWDDTCMEPAEFELSSVGAQERDEELCLEHASRMRDNLIAAGCLVYVNRMPEPLVPPYHDEFVDDSESEAFDQDDGTPPTWPDDDVRLANEEARIARDMERLAAGEGPPAR